MRRDPFERADTDANTYWDWYFKKIPWLQYGMVKLGMYLQTFQKYPPSQTATTFDPKVVTEKMITEINKRIKKGQY